MTLDEFRGTVALPEPSARSLALQALWWDAKGDWDRAHECAQANEAEPKAAWVHAYIHRKEGDLTNAAYWYRQAAHPVARTELDTEWAEISLVLLGSSNS